MKTIMNKMIMEIIFTILVIIYFVSRSIIYGEQGGNIGTEPVTIQYGEGLPPMYGDEQQQQQQNYEKEEEEEEDILGDDDLTVNVFNFPSTFLS